MGERLVVQGAQGTQAAAAPGLRPPANFLRVPADLAPWGAGLPGSAQPVQGVNTEEAARADGRSEPTEPVPDDTSVAGAAAQCEWAIVDPEGLPVAEVGSRLRWTAPCNGWELWLLERDSPDQVWKLRRRAHVACPMQRSAAQAVLAEASARLIRQGAKDRALGHPAKALPPDFIQRLNLPAGRSRHALPRLQDLVNFAALWWNRQLARLQSETWCVGVIDAPIHQVLQNDRLPVRWITHPESAGYWADPFGLPGSDSRVAVEFFDQRTGLGRLETITLDTDDSVRFREKVNIGHELHASFPTMFEVDGQCLALAETAATDRVTLYKVDARGQWTEPHDLITGVRAADPVLFKHEGLYWLAYTDLAVGNMDNLCLMFAEDWRGPWQPHANNPVKVDIRGARMAGRPFVHAGHLYRPAQDCLQSYGSSIVVHRVDRLSPTSFEETLVRRLAADPHSHLPHGMHTLSAWGNRTLVDAKIERMNLVSLLRKVRMQTGRAPQGVAAQHNCNDDRVFVYIPHLRTGGGEISMLRVAEGLAERGLEVELVVHDAETRELSLPRGVTLIDLQAKGTAQALRKLTQRIKKRAPRFVISAFPHTNMATVAAVKLAGNGCLSIVTEHAPLSHQIAQQNNWRYRLLPPLVRLAYRQADAVVAVSNGVREDLKRMVGRSVRIHCINNPVLPDDFELVADQEPDHPWLNDPSLQVVMSMCRLSAEKDIPTLIRAFARLRASHPVARLLLVGEGPERERLQALIDEAGLGADAALPGRTDAPLAWMRKAAVFVLPSTFEGYGNVLVEALAVGTPVVSTDCPVGPREILDNGRFGDLVPVHDDLAMSRAISQALTVRRVPEGATAAARRRTQSRACDEYLALLNHLDLTRG